MSDPIKYDSTSSEPIGNPEEDYQYPDPYSNYEGDDFGFGDTGDVTGSGDVFIPGEDSSGGSSGAPGTVYEARQWLLDLKNSGQITPSQYTHFLQQVNSTMMLSPSAQAEALSGICGSVSALFAPPPAPEDGLGLGDDLLPLEDPSAQGDTGLKGEIQSFIDTVNGNDNLSAADKQDFVGQAEKLLTDLDLAGGDETAQGGVEEKLSDLQESYSSFLQMPSGISDLAKKYHKDVSELTALAEQHGVDLTHLPDPPDQSVFEFLADLDPQLGRAVEDAKDAVTEKGKSDGDMTRRATESSAKNANDTTAESGDHTDFDAFTYLMQAQHFEDSGSLQVVEAFNNVAKKLKNSLKDLYPDATISVVGGSDYRDAGQIKFNGETIDVVENKSGNLISGSPSSDHDPDIPPPVTLEYDWEGDGDWEDDGTKSDKLKVFQNASYPTHAYDTP